jgi:hypothetical protein
MRYSLLLLACAAVLGACDSPPSAPEAAPLGPSLATVRFNERFPFSITVANPCPPAEDVAVEGTLHVVQHGETDESGSAFRTHLNLHGKGVGAVTGQLYELVQTGRQEAEVTTTPFGIITESTSNFGLIRQGSLDNVFVHARLRVVCDENGCRAEIDQTETECRG